MDSAKVLHTEPIESMKPQNVLNAGGGGGAAGAAATAAAKAALNHADQHEPNEAKIQQETKTDGPAIEMVVVKVSVVAAMAFCPFSLLQMLPPSQFGPLGQGQIRGLLGGEGYQTARRRVT